jgi:hypothetical protein
LRVGDRIEAISALVLGRPLLRPRDDFAPSILASMLYALKKLPIFLVSTRILVVILIAHDSPWDNEKSATWNAVARKLIARLQDRPFVIMCLLGNSFVGDGIFYNRLCTSPFHPYQNQIKKSTPHVPAPRSAKIITKK